MIYMAKAKIAYWIDEKTGGYVELAGTKWDGDLSDKELLAKAQEVAEEEGMDLSYGKIIIETVEEEEE
jgi:tRNA G26 N,N-dimethylase Trm1